MTIDKRIQFTRIVGKLREMRVAVIGDAMLDSYLLGHSSNLASEAPVPVVHVERMRHTPGGAANTAVNIAALGATPILLSVIGNDPEGMLLTQKLREQQVATDHLLQVDSRVTLTKRRILANSQTTMRLDSGDTDPLDQQIEKKLAERLADVITTCDALIISDYTYGVLTPYVISLLSRLSNVHPLTITADSKDLRRLRSIRLTAVKPNYREMIRLLNLPEKTSLRERDLQVQEEGGRILELVGARIAAVTIDRAGAVVFEKDKPPYRTYSKQVKDDKTVGAGDTYISALTLALAAGAPVTEAAEFASAASLIATSKDGTTPCYIHELQNQETYLHKQVRDEQHLETLVREARSEEKQIVFTNGCFDILHRGHVTYLNQAKALGDILIVGINTDQSIARLKGADRPINRLEDRINVLSGLSSVDYIIPFGEDTPDALLRVVRPDIFTKGGTYTERDLPEADLVRELGGRIEILPYIGNQSTSNIIHKIQNRGGARTA